jgi:hypothetical protein
VSTHDHPGGRLMIKEALRTDQPNAVVRLRTRTVVPVCYKRGAVRSPGRPQQHRRMPGNCLSANAEGKNLWSGNV